MSLSWKYPETLYYDRKHGWLAVEEGLAVQGMTSYGQHLAGKIMFIEIPRLGRQVRQGENLLSMESGKWVGRIPSLVSGKIIAVNQELEDTPSLINDSPYDFGWLVKIEMSDPTELGRLMRAGSLEMEQFLKEEAEKYA
ncbi:MAG: glycine cleavage system protein GcvH [Anaerolineaceae bacterium]|nr:glycine cleavage system protein GcvH [Anaerolineaceae bacterium]